MKRKNNTEGWAVEVARSNRAMCLSSSFRQRKYVGRIECLNKYLCVYVCVCGFPFTLIDYGLMDDEWWIEVSI